MRKVISFRLNKELEVIIKRNAKDYKKDKSEMLRGLIRDGVLYQSIKKYVRGEISVGKAAYLANLSLSDFIEGVIELGITSKISDKEILQGYEYLKALDS